MRVTFLHPDLGIGGAERLIVDAALALQRKGHQIRHHGDPVVSSSYIRLHVGSVCLY